MALLEKLRVRLAGPEGQVWAGDDVAVIPGSSGDLLLATDAVVAGVHADLSLVGIDDLGWKALVANLSDVAAMGGRPMAAVVAIAGPLGDVDLDLLYDGILEASASYACPVVGGDLTSATALVVSVSIVGDAGPPEPPPVLRSGARPGDHLFVTAALGASAAGLALLQARREATPSTVALMQAHRRPRARLAEGAAARRAGASAMIDVSDGLASEVHHIAAASGVGVVVEIVPVAPGVEEASDDPERLALGGGEDYELVFAAADPEVVMEGFSAAGLSQPIRIGRCTDDPAELRLRGGPLPAVGWEHRW